MLLYSEEKDLENRLDDSVLSPGTRIHMIWFFSGILFQDKQGTGPKLCLLPRAQIYDRTHNFHLFLFERKQAINEAYDQTRTAREDAEDLLCGSYLDLLQKMMMSK